ncbi:MAG: BolA/IbaG family iron-sulfur metabolism protein [Gammaproteobacteria bacterium]|nr:BolA/IbaG family iron-sulfur metabolism protein [Gammaproteobacteria bacterium]
MDKDEIKRLISAGLAQAEVHVTGDDGAHFQALVICESFAGKRTLERHKLVYATLGEAMGREIHALSLRTLTPSEADSGSARGPA